MVEVAGAHSLVFRMRWVQQPALHKSLRPSQYLGGLSSVYVLLLTNIASCSVKVLHLLI